MRMAAGESNGDVAVVITHYRNPDDLRRSLMSIPPAGLRIAEVWVVDSEAISGVRELVREIMPRAHYLPFRLNVGFAALVNMGMAASTAQYVCVLNADVQLAEGCVDELASELDRESDLGVVFPQLRYVNDSLQHSTFAFYRPSTVLYRRTFLGKSRWGRRELDRFMVREPLEAALMSGRPFDVDWSLGAAMMIRRDTFEHVGPFDEEYFLYFEDVDWCLRAWRSGWRCSFLPTATCIHNYGRASAAGGFLGLLTNRLTRRHIRSAMRFFRLHGLRVDRQVVSTQPAGRDLTDPQVRMSATMSSITADVVRGSGE
jgi:GT2 family glycosyltransferase